MKYRIQKICKNKIIANIDFDCTTHEEAKKIAEIKAVGCERYNLLYNMGVDFSSCAFLVWLQEPCQQLSLF